MSEKIKRPTVSGKTWQSLVRENEQLKKALYEWEEREAAVCPEDFGFEEVIKQLKAERDALKCCGNCLRYEDICFETTEGELIPRLMFRQDDRICPSWQPKEQGNEHR